MRTHGPAYVGGSAFAGLLPSLMALADGAHTGLHTLYVSPLKALGESRYGDQLLLGLSRLQALAPDMPA